MQMSRRPLMGIGVAGLTLASTSRALAEPGNRPFSLDAMLRPYLQQYGLPAVGAAVVHRGQLVAYGAAGTRRVGTRIPVTPRDRFHIGSDTKGMTVLLAAHFIEQDKIRWDTRLEDVFPDLKSAMKPDFAAITMTQLMSHTSGLPGDNPEIDALYNEAMLQTGNLDAQRHWIVQQSASRPVPGKAGETWAYSNLGYIILGAVLERTGGQTWEELIVAHVFDPLGLRSAGFGPQSSLGRVDAPLGHTLVDGKQFAWLAGPNGDNPAVMGPAGTVHLSLLDFADWANWQVSEGRRGPHLVSADAMRRMHTKVINMPVQSNAPTGTPGSIQADKPGYALGWGNVTLPFSKEPFVFHGGSNEKNNAMILMQPQFDYAMVLVTNIGGPQGDNAFKALGAELYRQFMSR